MVRTKMSAPALAAEKAAAAGKAALKAASSAKKAKEVPAPAKKAKEQLPAEAKKAQGKKHRNKQDPHTALNHGVGYKSYIYKVMRQVYPEANTVGMSSRAMDILNGMVIDLIDRLSKQAADFADHSGGVTMTSRHVQLAVRSIFKGQLAHHGVSEISKATNKYEKSVKTSPSHKAPARPAKK